jgi:hypothetical protein
MKQISFTLPFLKNFPQSLKSFSWQNLTNTKYQNLWRMCEQQGFFNEIKFLF